MAEDEVTTELTLPGMELPEYHGQRPSKMKTGVNGTGNKITSAHSIGDRVIFIAEAVVRGAGHDLDGDDLVYVEKLTVRDLYEIQGASGKRLLSAVRSAYRAASDGAETLLGDLGTDEGASGRTDASGVVITPGDAMGIEGDPLVDALTDTSKTPVVVIYSDGGRELWPDEFDPGDPRPVLGSTVLDEHEVESVVVRILDGVTGETLEEWTEEQENARLLALEGKLERGEALERLGLLQDRFTRNELDDDERAELRELLDRFEAEARADREVMDEIRPEVEEGAVGDPTPLEQVDPPEANEDLDGDPEDTFPGYASDGPDEELVIEEEDQGEPAPAEVVDPMPDDVPPAFDPERDPTPEECLFVDRDVKDLKPMIAELEDRDEVLGYLIAEEAGRGRNLKPRKGVLEALTKRAAELFTEEPVAPPALPAPGPGFEPPAGDDEWED